LLGLSNSSSPLSEWAFYFPEINKMAAKQLFARQNQVQDSVVQVLESGDVLFPSQKKIHGQMTHIISVVKKSDAEIRPHVHLTGDSGSGKSFLTKMIAKEKS
jgi:Holliday junction resolvasome RuvABC ATP-dependent DNA helicase subunit